MTSNFYERFRHETCGSEDFPKLLNFEQKQRGMDIAQLMLTTFNDDPDLLKKVSSAANNASFKNRAQNIECSFSFVAHSAVLLKPNVVNILRFNFCKQKFVQHGPITIAIDCNYLSLLIVEDKWPNYASGPKSAPNSDLFWVPRLFNVCVWVFCCPTVTILLVYIPAKLKMSFIWKNDFFPKSAYSISRLQAHFPALFKPIHNYIRSTEV